MILIYDRSDLITRSENKTIRQITLSDFRFSKQSSQLASAIIFLDTEKGLMRIMKWRWKYDFDINAIFSSNEFSDFLKDALQMSKSLGKSLLNPGTNKLRK